MTKITLKQLEQNLQKSENKLKPLEKGDYIGRVIRQIDAGWDKFIHLFTQRKWISRQEFELKTSEKF
ncbi:MAG: hypothetical protein HWD61_13050 [Parachlamydiaceae bacterium]|nr:MAG: hypothetical protein HWD61_13050 [Parachlamydiaceae bacterium]